MCRSSGEGALLFATHLQDAQHRALAIRSSGWSYREGASWEFAQHIPLSLQLRNQSEWPCCLHTATTSVLSGNALAFCRQALSSQTVKYPAFCEVQSLLRCSQTPLCALIVICATLGASRKSQNLSTRARPSGFSGCPFQTPSWGRHDSCRLPLFQWESMGWNTFRCLWQKYCVPVNKF